MQRRTMATTVAVLVTSGAAGALVGLGTAPDASNDRSARASENREHRELRELTGTEEFQVDRARERLIRKCMARQGYPYWSAELLSPEERAASRFVIDDVGWAREHGYGGRIDRKVLRAEKRDRTLAYEEGLSKAARARYEKALSGGPETEPVTVELPTGAKIENTTGGCEAKAESRLYGDREAWIRSTRVVANLSPLYAKALTRDKRFTREIKAWSACMRGYGHDYADPESVRSELPSLTKGMSGDKAHAREVAIATDEARCAKRNATATTVRKLEHHYRATRCAKYRDEIETSQRLALKALDRAKHVNS